MQCATPTTVHILTGIRLSESCLTRNFRLQKAKFVRNFCQNRNPRSLATTSFGNLHHFGNLPQTESLRGGVPLRSEGPSWSWETGFLKGTVAANCKTSEDPNGQVWPTRTGYPPRRNVQSSAWRDSQNRKQIPLLLGRDRMVHSFTRGTRTDTEGHFYYLLFLFA